jgi:hypothetical protein
VDSGSFGSISVRVASRGNFAAEEAIMSNPAYSRVAAYHWYLGSAFWRERREFILGRANHICEKCEKRRATEVHHLTYIRVFQELPSDLIALCPATPKFIGGNRRTTTNCSCPSIFRRQKRIDRAFFAKSWRRE